MDTQRTTQAQPGSVPVMQALGLDAGLIDSLCDLVQMDIDAVYAYEQAMMAIKDPSLLELLSGFAGDHERHVLELSSVIIGLEGVPPSAKKAHPRAVTAGFREIKPERQDDFEVLQATIDNERITNDFYEGALSWSLPEELRRMIQEFREDERRHLETLRNLFGRMTERLVDRVATPGLETPQQVH